MKHANVRLEEHNSIHTERNELKKNLETQLFGRVPSSSSSSSTMLTLAQLNDI